MSFGIIMTMEVSHLLRGFLFRRIMDVILWCSFHILSPKPFSFSLYWLPLWIRKLWRWPTCLSDDEIVVVSFHFLNTWLCTLMEYVYFCLFLWVLCFVLSCWGFLNRRWHIRWWDIWCSLQQLLGEKGVAAISYDGKYWFDN